MLVKIVDNFIYKPVGIILAPIVYGFNCRFIRKIAFKYRGVKIICRGFKVSVFYERGVIVIYPHGVGKIDFGVFAVIFSMDEVAVKPLAKLGGFFFL